MIEPSHARELVERFGSPLYAYELDEVERRADELARLLPGSTLLYSLKANPLPELTAALRAQGCRAEISSEGELRAALEAGFEGGEMLYTGPGKTDEELAGALAAGVSWFSCESWTDLARVRAAAGLAGRRPRVLLRLNPTAALRSGLAMSGRPSQFGFDERLLGSPDRGALDGVDVAGFHVFFGSQMHPGSLVESFAAAAAAAESAAETLELDLRVVDFGGGFPWPYAVADDPPDLSAAAPPVRALLRGFAARHPHAEAWFESGRYLAASSGSLLARVQDVKRAGDRTYVVLDAGINALGGMSGLGRVMRPAASFSVDPLRADGEQATSGAVEVVGPLCAPLDVLAKGAYVEEAAPGAVVTVPNVGAYGLTASLVAFLGRPCPLELVLRGGEVVAARRLRLEHAAVPVAEAVGAR